MSYKNVLFSVLAFLLAFQCAGVYAATEQVTYVHTDHLGSPILGRDATGATVFEYDYKPYGARDVSQGDAGFVGYTGHAQSDGLGLVYARARWIDPAAGRFLSPDKVDYHQGGEEHFGRYLYALNNPYGFIDPTGHWSVDLEGYYLLGGGARVSYKGGTLEITGRLALGFGGGLSIDPDGGPSPHSKSEGSDLIARLSAKASAGVGFAGVGVSANAEAASGNGLLTRGSYVETSTSGIYDTKPQAGLKAGFSVGAEAGSYTNDVCFTCLWNDGGGNEAEE